MNTMQSCYFNNKTIKEKTRRILLNAYLNKTKPNQVFKSYRDTSHRPSLRTIFRWYQRFDSGILNTSDLQRSGHPITSTNKNMCDLVRDQLEENNCELSIEQLKQKLNETGMNKKNISVGSIHTILHKKLKKQKNGRKWIDV